MKSMDSDQIERLLEDITLIKTAINRNKPLLRQVFNPARFRWFMLIAGFSIIGFSLLIYLLMGRYGGFSTIPPSLRYLLYAAIAADLVFLQVWKLKRFSVSVKKIDQGLTLGWFFREFYSGRIAHLWIPLIVLVVFFSIFFLVHGIPYYIVPVISIGYGLLSNFVGTMLEIKYSLIVGYWFLITGVITVVFSSIPGPIALCMTLGCGLLVFSFAGFLGSGSKEGD